jgi:uncharacterized protein
MGRDYPCSHRRAAAAIVDSPMVDSQRSSSLLDDARRRSSCCLGRPTLLVWDSGSRGDGEGEPMIATTNRNALDSGWRVRAIRRCAAALGLLALCCASGAKAGSLSAGKRAFERHDYVRAASLLFAEAERGSPVAQTYLGYMYQYGLGVPQDYVRATSWLHQAAEQGEPTGQFLLGLLFDKGYGVPQDWVQAEVWLNLAAAHAGARQQEYYARVRDAVAQKLTLNQLAETQRRASAWTPTVSQTPAPLAARY